ncbi:phage tail protein [uncultured Brevundimonas sp.]|uniref:phage tail protein n=1 Tax=uncultured Brevundimonas sp. TaxID=213418 RepID=UPI0025970FA7|nr:phage tail protein [uncultured Brevundimonas sp.]
MKLRRLLMASALALSFTVTAPTVAKADPISAAVVAFVGFTGTAAAVATFVINSALYAAGSWAVSKAAQALGLNKNAVQERQASVTTLSLGETPRELVVGEACTGGSLVDAWNWGGKYKTDYVTRCIALADHQVDRLVGYYVDDQYFEYTANGNQSAFNGALRLIFVNATANGSNPPADVGAADGGWTNADKVVGVTHVWVVTRIDDKVWTQGHPRFKFVLRGLKVYDPRFDPALGYVGPIPQTWDDPSTHRFTRNAALLDYAYDRGIYATGRQGQDGHLLIGRGLSAEEAPPERIIAAANLCDEIVDGEPRYSANGVISAAQSFLEVKQAFASAMAGIIIQPDGGVAIEPGQAKAVVATITDGDLVGGEAKSFSEFLPDTDGGRVNTVVPRYVEPSQGYKDHSGAVRRDLADLAADGGPRELTLPLLLVTSARQADWCAEITRLKARLERRATIVLPPDYAEIEEGDWIAWHSARHHGGATVRYRVTSWSLDEDWRQHLTLEEIASSVYGVPDPAPDVTNPPPPPVPVDALQLFGPKAEAITLAGEIEVDDGAGGTIPAPGTAIPAVRFTWGRTFDEDGGVDQAEAPDAALVQVRAEIRRAGSTDVASVLTDDLSGDGWVVTNGVVPDATLECRLTPIAASPTRPVLPSEWMTVTTSSVTATPGPVSPDDPVWAGLNDLIGRTLQDAIDDLTGMFDEEDRRDISIDDLLDRLGLLGLLDPVEGTAMLWGTTVFQGAGPGGLDESLVQMTARLVAADEANAATSAQVLIDAKAYTNGQVATATLNLVSLTQMNGAISASVLSQQSWTNGRIATATANLATRAEVADAVSASELNLYSYVDDEIATATAELVTQAEMGGAISASVLSQQSWTNGRIATATASLVTGAQLNDAIGATRLELYSYVDDEVAEAVAGLASVAQMNSAIAANELSLQSWTNGRIATATASLATQASLNGVNATASLALSAATGEGGSAYAALTVDANGRMTQMRVNGVTRAIDFLAEQFNITAGAGGGVSYSAAAKLFKIFDETSKTVLKAGGAIRLWSGPASVADGAETEENGVLAVGPGVTGGGRFNGQTLSSPFEATGVGPIVVTGWTTVASTTARLMLPGKVSMAARWRATLSPAYPPSEAPSYGLSWRLVSTDPSGGDVRPIVSGYVDGAANLANIVMGVDRAQGLITTNGQRVLRLQLALSGSDDTTAASARDVQLVGDYLAGATLAPF